MKHQITHAPLSAVVEIQFETEGEAVIAQPNSMLTMTSGIDVTARLGGQIRRGGLLSGIQSMLGGEKAFSAVFTARREGERLALAPETLGEIVELSLSSGGYYITRGAFLACDERVEIALTYGGLKGLLARKGIFFMHATGNGCLFLASFGAVVRARLGPGEQLIIDNRYVVAFSDTITYDLVKASRKLSHSLLSGEGLVNRYTGPGELLYQTRPRQKNGNLLADVLNVFT